MYNGSRSSRLPMTSKFAALLLFLLAAIFPVHIKPDMVRFGVIHEFDPSRKDKVGVVDSKKVYMNIPPYKRIINEKIEKGSALHTQLLAAATTVYKKCIFKVGKSHYVLIVEKGGVKDYPTTNVTEQCIEAL